MGSSLLLCGTTASRYTTALNKFADLPNAEYQKLYLKTNPTSPQSGSGADALPFP
jgi:hypothetical protein